MFRRLHQFCFIIRGLSGFWFTSAAGLTASAVDVADCAFDFAAAPPFSPTPSLLWQPLPVVPSPSLPPPLLSPSTPPLKSVPLLPSPFQRLFRYRGNFPGATATATSTYFAEAATATSSYFAEAATARFFPPRIPQFTPQSAVLFGYRSWLHSPQLFTPRPSCRRRTFTAFADSAATSQNFLLLRRLHTINQSIVWLMQQWARLFTFPCHNNTLFARWHHKCKV